MLNQERSNNSKRTSAKQLSWAGKKLLQVFAAFFIVWLLIQGWSVLTDHRPIKVEQYYPDAAALQQALYKAYAVGSPVEYFMNAMQRSQMKFGGDPILEKGVIVNHGALGHYTLKSKGARQVLSYYYTWDGLCLVYGAPFKTAGIDIEYDQDEKITGIFVSMGQAKCELGL